MIVEYKNINKIKINDFLASFYISKSNINKLLLNSAITDDEKLVKDSDTIEGNLYIDFSSIEDNINQAKTKMDLDIIYEDDNFIAVDKPRKVLVHSDGITTNTILNGVVYYLQEKHDDSYIRPLHRIDYDTAGVVLFSKNLLSYCFVSHLIEENNVIRKYHTLTEGIISSDIKLKYNIGRDRHNAKKYCISKTGKESITNIHVLKINKKENNTFVEAILETGRPHQIRVSLKEYNHPVIGDNLYGTGNNLMLLSKEFSFKYLNKQVKIISKKEL